IFTVTLMLTVLLLVYQRGLNMLLAVLFGLSSGLLILSKPTAWVLFPTIVLFILLFARFATPKLIAYSVVVLTTTIIAGGWWIVFNIHHYGANDPFARKIAIHHAEQRSRLKPNVAKSFNEKGVSYYDLFIGSHRNFWGATARSTIGKLDWLKLNMGAMQYTLYLAVFFVALAYYFLRVGGFMLSGLSKQGDVDSADRRQLVLEGLLFFAIVFQISMYVWRNMNTEIQLQGKYIIPVALAVLFLFFAATHRFGNWLTDTLNEKGIYSLSIVDINRAGLLLFSVSIILIHLQGLWAHVIPFYRPRVHDLSMSGFRPLNINNTDVTIIRDIDTIEVSEGSLRISMTGPDPQLVLDPKFCESIIGNVLLKAKFQSDGPGLLQIFVDQGRGFNEDDSYRAKYGNDGSEVLVAMGNEHCSRIRLDPGTQPGQVVIDNISVARVRIRPLN
ncbi:MAG: hypothetical protein OEU36_22620, partial [Gammaproteobacteria bacterium]|nr:hypothetical protein [Gammaproteobacteria bacterium]